MDGSVTPTDNRPRLVTGNVNYTQIVVDRTRALDGTVYDIMFIGTGGSGPPEDAGKCSSFCREAGVSPGARRGLRQGFREAATPGWPPPSERQTAGALTEWPSPGPRVGIQARWVGAGAPGVVPVWAG